MPQFKVKTPDDSIVTVQAPDGATEQQAIEFAARAWKPKERSSAPATSAEPKVTAGDFLNTPAPLMLPELASKAANAVGIRAPSPTAEVHGLGEAGLSALSGMVTTPLSFLAGLSALPDTETAAGRVKAVRDMGYSPTSAEGKRIAQALSVLSYPISKPIEALAEQSEKLSGKKGMKELVESGLGTAAEVFGGKVAPRVAKAAGEARAESAAERAATAGERAPIVESAKMAKDLGFKIPPQELSGGKAGAVAHELRAMVDKESLTSNYSIHNADRVGQLLREDLDIPRGTPLSKQLLETNIKREGQAYEGVRRVPYRLDLSGPYQEEIRNIGGAYAEAARKYVETHGRKNLDPLIDELAAGESSSILLPSGQRATGTMSPSDAIDNIRRLRERATNYLDATNADPTARDMGMAYRDAADALENMVASNLERHGNKALFDQFQKARVKIAKNYDAMAALHEASGTFDASLYAKLFDDDKTLSGNAEKIGRMASAYPDYFQAVPKAAGRTTGSHKTSFGVATEVSGIQPLMRKILSSRKVPWQNVDR